MTGNRGEMVRVDKIPKLKLLPKKLAFDPWQW